MASLSDLEVSYACPCCPGEPNRREWRSFLESFSGLVSDGVSVGFRAAFRGSDLGGRAERIDDHLRRVLLSFGVGEAERRQLVGVVTPKHARDN